RRHTIFSRDWSSDVCSSDLYMKWTKLTLLCFLVFWSLASWAQKPEYYYVRISTSKGEAVLKLYNETPKHRNNFHKLVKEGFYDSLLFHRVIHNFMIPGGDPDSRYAA